MSEDRRSTPRHLRLVVDNADEDRRFAPPELDRNDPRLWPLRLSPWRKK